MLKRTRRTFTPQLKAEVVPAVLTGAGTQADLGRRHGLKPELIALWKRTFPERMPLAFAGQERNGQEAVRVADPERLVGRLTPELDVPTKASALLPSVLPGGGRS
jgi:transposase